MKFFNKKLLSVALTGLIAFSPFFMSSCSKDDDDNGSSSQQQNNNNNNNNNNTSEGEGSYNITGDVQTSFSGETFYADTSNFYNYNDALFISGGPNDSTSVTAIIVNQNSSGSIGAGTYKVKKLDSATAKGSNVFLNLPSRPSTFFSTASGGSVVINSRSSGVIEGKYNNVQLVGFSTSPDTVILNGTFKAKAR